jgi:phosphoribosylanthranilate isomerase
MALKTTVKVGNVSNLSDARYCSGMGVQYLGFSLDRDNENYVDPDTLKSIKDWVVGPEIVGEFLTSDQRAIEESIQQYELDCIQISDVNVCEALAPMSIPVILALDISTYQNPTELSAVMTQTQDLVDFFLLFKSNSTVIQTEDVFTLARDFKIMVGYGIDKDSIHSWIDKTNVFGICLKGSTEIKPGFKDYDELADILELLEVE